MPELPEVESLRRSLEPVLAKARIVDVEVRRPDLRVPFPRRFRLRLAGQTVLALTRRAKYLLATLSSGETLLVHLGMSGWFRIESARHAEREDDDDRAAPSDPHDHVVFHLSSGAIVTFNDPRRFGLMNLLTPAQRTRHPVLSRLGPEPLSADFDAAALARACKGRKLSLKLALLDQRVVAGLGNIYASEALHVAGLSPSRRASTMATPTGAPREGAHRLTAAIKQVLTEAIERTSEEGMSDDRTSDDRTSDERTSDTSYRASRFRVYDREGEPCLRPGCRGAIKRRTQAGRSTFYCPVCQR